METSPGLISYEDRTFYSTWEVSFNYVKQQNSRSAQLLRLWAYFDNQDLWFELLRHRVSEAPDWIQEVTKDELTFHSVVRVLCDHGLVEVDASLQEPTESRGYSIHTCVHSWTIHVLNQEWDFDLARVAVELVGSHIPEDENRWLIQRRLLQHVTRCSYIMSNGLVTDDGMEWIYDKLGALHLEQGNYAKAKQMFERALQGYEKTCGPEHTSTLGILHNLGMVYSEQGELVEASEMFQRALEGLEKVQDLESGFKFQTINCLGLCYKEQNKLMEAEQLYNQVLQGCEETLGPEHTTTLSIVMNLGVLYKTQDRLVEAEKMYQRGLRGYEKICGTDNLAIYLPALKVYWAFGNLFRCQNDLPKAKTMYAKALTGLDKVLGPEHPDSRTVRQKLQSVNHEMEEEVLHVEDAEQPPGNPQEEVSILDTERYPSKKRFRKMFRKLGLS